MALLFRQTSVVWVAWIAGRHALEQAAAGRAPARLLAELWPYAAVLGLFTGFVGVNGGVVLGDRSNHRPTVNPAQLCYASVCVCLLLLPALGADRVLASVGSLGGWPYYALLLGHVGVVGRCSRAHCYQQYDAHHLATWLWGWAIGRGACLRYLWIPVYVACEKVVLDALLAAFGLPAAVLFLACAAGALVPAPLVEPRYFIVPAALLLRELPMDGLQRAHLVAAYIKCDFLLVLLLVVPQLLGGRSIIW